jgi:hypothetical protein
VLVPRYKLSLCHTPIKPDLLSFPGIGVFARGLRDHVITRFATEKQLIEEQLSSWRHPYTSRSRINIHWVGVSVSNNSSA